MTRIFLTIFLLKCSIGFCQLTSTKDSFFISQKKFPSDYKSSITNNTWVSIGFYTSTLKKILPPDTLFMKTRRFDNWGKIKGNKIICTDDCRTETIIYIDYSTLILESKYRKNGKNVVTRGLYRRK